MLWGNPVIFSDFREILQLSLGRQCRTENFCNFVFYFLGYSPFLYFPGQKSYNIRVSVNCKVRTNKLTNITFGYKGYFMGPKSAKRLQSIIADKMHIQILSCLGYIIAFFCWKSQEKGDLLLEGMMKDCFMTTLLWKPRILG